MQFELNYENCIGAALSCNSFRCKVHKIVTIVGERANMVFPPKLCLCLGLTSPKISGLVPFLP